MARSATSPAAPVDSSAARFHLGIGPEAEAILKQATEATLQECMSGQRAVGAFLTRPLGQFHLPQQGGTVLIWIGLYEVRLSEGIINDIVDARDPAPLIAALVGSIVGVTGGIMAPVAGFLTACLAGDIRDISEINDLAGVKLRGAYSPPSPVVVVAPGNF